MCYNATTNSLHATPEHRPKGERMADWAFTEAAWSDLGLKNEQQQGQTDPSHLVSIMGFTVLNNDAS